MLNIFAAWRRERDAVRELSRLSDRALADLGIARADIPGLVSGAARGPAAERTGAMAPAWGAHLRASVAA